MPNIHTLIKDIQEAVTTNAWFDYSVAQDFTRLLGQRLVENTDRSGKVPSLRLSQMGPRCPKQLWHSIHTPSLAEEFPPSALIKFTYGHILEEYVISMAKAAGHEVTGEQDELVVDGVVGHRDCVIDGCVVDVKSASSLSFQKFKDGSIRDNDSFGYLDQLDGYLVGSLEDSLVRVKDKGYLLAIDKTLGHLALYEHHARIDSIRIRIAEYKRIVALEQPPKCTCGTVPDGASGNIKLDTRASYSNFKHVCFPHLRTFLYAKGPVYLTKVVRRPADHIIELDKNGKRVYN